MICPSFSLSVFCCCCCCRCRVMWFWSQNIDAEFCMSSFINLSLSPSLVDYQIRRLCFLCLFHLPHHLVFKLVKKCMIIESIFYSSLYSMSNYLCIANMAFKYITVQQISIQLINFVMHLTIVGTQISAAKMVLFVWTS